MKICPLNIKCEKFSLVLVFIASVLFYFPAISQNLLSNGDFELYSTLPNSTNQANRCIGWNRLSGTPDYYHADGFMNPTQWGVTPAKSGKGQMNCNLLDRNR